MCGVYVHLPFCIKKCRYCDFVSYENKLAESAAYIDALCQEMRAYRGETVDTIYLGGGTPTALSSNLLCHLLAALKENFFLSSDCEITVEANPGTVTKETFAILKGAGVNRISLGVQSFCDKELLALGRIHTAKDAEQAFSYAKDAGISNISIDLMFSIPEQTEESFLNSIEQALSLQPNHISCYSLTLCEGTPLFNDVESGKIVLPEDDEDRDFYDLLVRRLGEAGIFRYEISNFAREGFESRHNKKYWQRKDTIGLGAGAHSFYKGARFENPPAFSAYYDIAYERAKREKTFISKNDAMAEAMFLGLRMTREGVLCDRFLEEFGVSPLEVYQKPLEKLERLGLLTVNPHHICLTNRGVDLSNSVMCEFL